MEEQIRSDYKPQNSVFKVIVILAIALAIPITVTIVQQQQDIRQHASEPVPQEKPQTVILGGYVYTDANVSGHRDTNENPLSNIQIQISQLLPGQQNNGKTNQEVVLSTVTTDTNGYFSYTTPSEFNLRSLVFTLRLILPAGYKDTTPNPVIVSANANKAGEFGVVSEVPAPTVSVTSIPLRTFVPPGLLVPHPTK